MTEYASHAVNLNCTCHNPAHAEDFLPACCKFIEDADLLAAFEGEVAEDIFITSQAELVHGAGPAEAFRMDGEAAISALPGQASGVKCARSWKYFEPATADADFPDVTPRDAAAIREIRG